MALAADPADAVLFAGVSLVLGITCRHLLRGTRVPYTIALLVLGIALGWLEYGTSGGLGKLGAGIRIWAGINPDLLLAVFLPALLFESSFSMEAHQIKRCMAQMLLLAGPGVVISTFIIGTAIKVLSVLKARQVTYSVLTHMNQYIQKLWKTGLLEEKEMFHLDNALQIDLKKLKRNPPLVKMSRVGNLLCTHPVVSILSAAVRDRLLSNATETVKAYGPLLYREGSVPTGVWFVSLGIEKWTSLGQLGDSKTRGQPSDPVLLHGSTLGLYEVLTGKPYICDMIMNPVVHYFFIEAEKIEQLCQTDPFVDALLWKESALVIAKLFTPGIFEKMTMHEMRLLNAEASSMNDIYNVGEDNWSRITLASCWKGF